MTAAVRLLMKERSTPDAAVEFPPPRRALPRGRIFCCLPHGASAEAVAQLVPRGKKIIDLSADYRLNNAVEYQKWYGLEHADPGRLGKVVYGLPEIYRERIQRADVVANPGCYPTSAILALAPLLRAGAILPRGIIIDSSVASCPPCNVCVDVNTPAGLPTSAPETQRLDVLSRKYLSGAAMLPKRVGLPMTRPAALRRASLRLTLSTERQPQPPRLSRNSSRL